MPDRRVTVSKFLSKHLRHDPAGLGLTLQPGGWVPVADLLAGAAARGVPITPAELAELVRDSDKQRFAFDDTGTRIRANQGHSAEVDLELTPAAPPAVLYHGTGRQTAPLIRRDGLLKMQRHHVHLSADPVTAARVGGRHGVPLVFTVDAAGLAAAGHTFYLAANGVWLTDHVPPQFLTEQA